MKEDGGDEVVAQAGKAGVFSAAIDTGVHRPPRRVVTQREGGAQGNGRKRSIYLGAEPIQVTTDMVTAAMGVVGIVSCGIEVG